MGKQGLDLLTQAADKFGDMGVAVLNKLGLRIPVGIRTDWVVDCRSVGNGEKALVYLGRYLYRGVIREQDIVSCEQGMVCFRYQDSQTKQMRTRTLPSAISIYTT